MATDPSIKCPIKDSVCSTVINGLDRDPRKEIRELINKVQRELLQVAKALAARKAQHQLLLFDLDMFSSLRIRIGKVFEDSTREAAKLDKIKECEKFIKALAIEEAEEDVEVLKASRLMYFESLKPHVRQPPPAPRN